MKGIGFSLRELRQHPEYLNAYVMSEDHTVLYHEKATSMKAPVVDYDVRDGKIVMRNDQKPLQWQFAHASPFEYTHTKVKVDRQALLNILRTMRGDQVTVCMVISDDYPLYIGSESKDSLHTTWMQEAVIAPIVDESKYLDPVDQQDLQEVRE